MDENYYEKYVVDISKAGVDLFIPKWETIYKGDTYTVDGEILLSNKEELFNTIDKYRITVESATYTGTFIVDYILPLDVKMYGIATRTDDEIIGFSSAKENLLNTSIDTMLLVSQENNMTIMGFDEPPHEYKFTKIERLRQNNELNEYGFVYNTWYECDSASGKAYMYFLPNNMVYYGMDVIGATVGLISTSKVMENVSNLHVVVDGNINDSSAMHSDYVTASKNELYHVEGEFFNKSDKVLTITKNDYGVYTRAIYLAKVPTLLGENVTMATLSVSLNDNGVYTSSIIGDDEVEAKVLGPDRIFNLDDYSVSADGKTIIDKTGDTDVEYVLLEELYELK